MTNKEKKVLDLAVQSRKDFLAFMGTDASKGWGGKWGQVEFEAKARLEESTKAFASAVDALIKERA